MRSVAKIIACLSLSLAASACSVTKPEQAYGIAKPKTDPARTTTSFSGALQCMDTLFLAHGIKGYQITSVGIPDATGQVSAGTREMLITAISRMTRKSGAFQYNDWELANQELNFLNDNDPNRRPLLPTYYIRGAITQLDKRVSDWRRGAGLSVDTTSFGGDAAIDQNQTASVLALDLNIGLIRTRQILPGLSASNSIAVSRKEHGWDAGLAIEQVGAFFSLEMARAEGMHYALRTLVELGLVEALGKLSRVPYWECLQIAGTNPKIIEEVDSWYGDMTTAERNTFAQRVLIANGYLTGEATGTWDEASRKALSSYQADNDLIATGRITFEVYQKMLGNRRPLSAGAPKSIAKKDVEPDFEKEQIPVRKPLAVRIKTVRGPKPVYALGEELKAVAHVSGDGYVYCYYQDAAGRVARVYPNRFAPNAFVKKDALVHVPTPNTPLSIVFDSPGASEELACIASDRELGLELPAAMKVPDLEPMPVANMSALIAAFEKLDGKVRRGLPSVSRMPIRVGNE